MNQGVIGMTVCEIIGNSIVYLIFIVSLGPLGNIFCRTIFKWSKLKKNVDTAEGSVAKAAGAENIQAGRLIGFFERTLVFIGVILKSWEILVAVVALKTVARYQELDKQINAEYFLIGSMASILFAVLVALSLIVYDQTLGFHLFQLIVEMLGKSS